MDGGYGCVKCAQGELPQIDIFEFTTRWTAAAWRGKGVSMRLHLPLVDRFLQGNALGLVGTAGHPAPALEDLGWQVLAWQAAEFVTSLIAVPASEFPAEAAQGWRTPAGLTPYQGPPVSCEDRNHPWEQHCYCWVSSPQMALELNQTLAVLSQGDLHRWRSAVVHAFARPESPHRLAFLGG